jgi:16S rRNA A1518/A1519 N6-dimethyltransferase RsmA/KsgA/DIM1 with predicted DNA glycosylase/AP lyase activity
MIKAFALQEDAVTLVHSDVLHIRDLPDRLAAFRATCPGCMRLKVVANIPYNITTGEGTVKGASFEQWRHPP